ncbi:MAG: hypothetical protein JO108_32755 [Acidobacteriaceae bacterium]|nr:hypothetical protein [Acidobacteriaceae bacterium]
MGSYCRASAARLLRERPSFQRIDVSQGDAHPYRLVEMLTHNGEWGMAK